MQAAGPTGLHPAAEGSGRSTIVCIHNATAGSEDTKLRAMWRERTPEQAEQTLSAPGPPPPPPLAASASATTDARVCRPPAAQT